MKEKIFALIGIALIVAVSGCTDYHGSKSERQQVIDMGYSIGDVDVFLKMVGMEYSEFIGSEGLRKQYDNWKNGTMDSATQLMIQNENNKQAAEKTTSGAVAGGLIGGMLGGMLAGGSK
jgi:hypothetical protein